MKKFYMLLVAVLVAATASAQVSVKEMNIKKDNMPYKGVREAVKGEPGEGWIFYQDMLESYFANDCNESEYAFRINFDSIGYHTYSDGTVGHPFLFSVAQAFDLTSAFYDDAVGIGNMSLVNSPSLNIDSIYLVTMYRRDENIPAGSMDTIIVGIVTDDNIPYRYYTAYPNSCFMDLDYDFQTGTQQNAHIYKFPIGAEDVSEPVPDQEGYYYLKSFKLPIGLNDITAKRWHVSYTFKPGYPIAMEDTIHSTFTAYFFMFNDAAGYSYNANNEFLCDNVSNGSIILSFSDGEIADYYYPTFFFEQFDFVQNLGVKVSCSNCEIVNVPEIEKTNPTVYPNPATNNFTVNLGNDEKANIQLFNIVGQQVYSETITGTAQVNVANLNSGVYMLKINQNGKVYTTKVVVR